MCKIKEYFKSISQKPSFYIVVFAVIFLLSYPISPLSDDWYYSTAPNPSFKLKDLLPSASFWRPFDALYGALLSNMPFLFPILNRILVILAHIINAVLLNGIIKELGVRKELRNFAVCFFLFSSSTWAVTLSPDALNQAYSAFWGMLALYLHLKKGGYKYLFLSFIGILTKESAVSWFFVIPLFDLIHSGKSWKEFIKNKQVILKFIKQIVFSLLTVAVYFAIRFALMGSITLGNDSGRYQLSLFSLSAIKNLFLLFASAATGIDSIALMGTEKSFLLVLITGVLSVIFIAAWVVGFISVIKNRKQLFSTICIIICGLGLAFPLVILGNAGEMHAYQVLFITTVLYAFVIEYSNLNAKKLLCPILCLFLAFAISSTHKITAIYEYSNRTKQLTQSIKNVYENADDENLFVVIDDWSGYSIFEQSAVQGTHYGLSMRPYYGWKDLKHKRFLAETEKEANGFIIANQEKYDHIFIIKGEAAKKIK